MRARRLGRFPASSRARSPSRRPRSVATRVRASRDGGAGAGGFVDRGGEQPGGEVVLAGREAHRQLALGSPVQLRRPPGAGPLTAGQPAVLGGQQPVGDEPVEVERGNRPGTPIAAAASSLLTAHRRGDDEAVQGPSLRFRQRRHAGDPLLEIVVGHHFDGAAATRSARRASAPSPRET